jgi:hypothetical protein
VFVQYLYSLVVNGSDQEISAISKEIGRSAGRLVRFAPQRGRDVDERPLKTHEQVANDILLLLANKRFSRQIATTAPGTLIAIVDEMKEQGRHYSVADRMIVSVLEEAIKDKSSILYHETEEFSTDLIGMMKPFTGAVFSEYRFVENLSYSFKSPLDLDFRIFWDMDDEQFSSYCRLVQIVFKNYINDSGYIFRSYSLSRAFGNIERAGQNLYKLDGLESVRDSIEVRKLQAAVDFVRSALDDLDKIEDFDIGQLRHDEKAFGHKGILDQLADLAFELIIDAAAIGGPPDLAWTVHHNIVWSDLFGLRKQGVATKAFRFKLSRLVFDEIKDMEKFPNFKGAKALGFCLNIFGMRVPEKSGYGSEERPLALAVARWTKKHYLGIWRSNRRVAEACLIGGVSFDEEELRLVKTYAYGTGDEPSKTYLDVA